LLEGCANIVAVKVNRRPSHGDDIKGFGHLLTSLSDVVLFRCHFRLYRAGLG
jgi:hypothetical protein